MPLFCLQQRRVITHITFVEDGLGTTCATEFLGCHTGFLAEEG